MSSRVRVWVTVDELIAALRGGPSAREISLAITKLQEARFWLKEAEELGMESFIQAEGHEEDKA